MFWLVMLLVPLHARAQTCHVIVTVDDGDDAIVGALVTLLNERHEVVASGTTDGTGRRLLDVAPGRYEVRASAPGLTIGPYSSAGIDAIDGDVAVGLRLWQPTVGEASATPAAAPSPLGEIRGRVRTPDGRPVSGATIEAIGYRVHGGRAVTARDGSYRLRVPPDTYNVTAHKGEPFGPRTTPKTVPPVWDYYPASFLTPPVHVVPEHIATAADLELIQTRAVRVTATVHDETGRVPAPVTVQYFSDRHSGERMADAGGKVEVGLLLPGVVVIRARAMGATSTLAGVTRVEVEDQPLDDVNLILSAGAKISGRVEFDERSRPLHNRSGLRVQEYAAGRTPFGFLATSRRGTVNADGYFELDGLMDGDCLMLDGIAQGWHLASIDLFGEQYLQQPFQLAAGQAVSGLVMRVVPDGVDAGDRGVCTVGRAGSR